jgi:hypothetical protein
MNYYTDKSLWLHSSPSQQNPADNFTSCFPVAHFILSRVGVMRY